VTRFLTALGMFVLTLAVLGAAAFLFFAWCAWSIHLPMPWAFLLGPLGPTLLAGCCLGVSIFYEDLKP
jgi:hypothetical protein